MKFLADMGISPRTVGKLRREGYDAVHFVYYLSDCFLLDLRLR
jgi:predicted nuclease of predicted toxin-antitoxin system